MRSKSIHIETHRLLPQFPHFHASTVSHFSFLERIAQLLHMMNTAAPFDAFQTDAIQFEDAKASQSDGGGFFKLSLYLNVKVSLMVM
jgi:hypothetical protein